MNLFKTLSAIAFVAFSVSSAHSIELVTNGDFESNPFDLGWSTQGQAAIGNWTNESDNRFSSNSAWLGGYNSADDTLMQSINTANMATGNLSFDLVVQRLDDSGFDFLDVSFGGRLLDRIDLGDTQDKGFISLAKAYDVSSEMGHGVQDLVFHGTTDWVHPGSAFIDNVSLDANPVPEPASWIALSIGALGLLRRYFR